MHYVYDPNTDALRYFGDLESLEYSMCVQGLEEYVWGVGSGVYKEDIVYARSVATASGLLRRSQNRYEGAIYV